MKILLGILIVLCGAGVGVTTNLIIGSSLSLR